MKTQLHKHGCFIC